MKFKSNFFHKIEKLNDLWNLNQAFNKTALILAAYYDHKEIVELLTTQEGIDVNIQGIFNQKRSWYSNLTFLIIFKILNGLGNLTRTFNKTALIHATEIGYREIVEILLRQEDIDVNILDILNQRHSLDSNPTFSIVLKFWMVYGILLKHLICQH